MGPTSGSLVDWRSDTACGSVLPQKSSRLTGSSGRSKRQSQYRTIAALVSAEDAWRTCATFPTGEVRAAGHDQTEMAAPDSFKTAAAQPPRGSDGGQLPQG